MLLSKSPYARVLTVLSALSLLGGACSNDADNDSPAKPGDAAADIGLGEIVDGGADDAVGSGEQPDLGSADVEPPDACPGGAGCPCVDNGDCDIALCIETPAGHLCAAKCVDNCPDGEKCVAVNAGGGDTLTICVPRWGRLCDPCASSKDCETLGLPDSACIEQGKDGLYCGVVCVAATDCPEGYTCDSATTAEGATTKQCVRLPETDGGGAGTCACSARAIDKKLSTVCFNEVKDDGGKVVGKCPGKRTCLETGLSNCAAPQVTPEVCDGKDNDCDGQTDEATCDDDNACTTDACDPSKAKEGDDGKVSGGCSHESLNGAACNADDDVCTEDDACETGVCKPGAAKECDDGNPCTADSCHMADGCTQIIDDGKPCDADGSLCTAGDTCQGGQCAAGKATTCDDENPCTDDACDPKTGKCGAKPVADGTACDDGSKCTTSDGCAVGACKGEALSCDDGNPCSTNTCDPKVGCKKESAGAVPCSDDNPCTIGDTCKDGGCEAGKPKKCESGKPCIDAECDLGGGGKCVYSNKKTGSSCDDGDKCTGSDGCEAGKCEGAKVDCDDKNPCTSDSCAANDGCAHVANTAACEDGDKCTLGDGCKDKGCVGGQKKVCDDGEECTIDGCDKATGKCVLDGKPQEGKDCDADGSVCTLKDACKAGKCVAGEPAVCKDGNGCTADNCDPKTGKCVFDAQSMNNKACSGDGSGCTVDDTCKSGTCVIGAKAKCELKVGQCEENACVSESPSSFQCVVVAKADVSPCDDGNGCTTADFCKSGKCVSGAKKTCSGQGACLVGACDSKTGNCEPVAGNEGKGCDDGSKCSEKDACKAGKCVGQVVKCDDGNICTDDSCDNSKGCQQASNTTKCADNDACTEKEVCAKGACVKQQLNCDDGNPCSKDSCNSSKGCGHDALTDKTQCSQDGKKWCESGACVPKPACGDGEVGSDEECDDGNTKGGDGCSAECKHETTYKWIAAGPTQVGLVFGCCSSNGSTAATCTKANVGKTVHAAPDAEFKPLTCKKGDKTCPDVGGGSGYTATLSKGDTLLSWTGKQGCGCDQTKQVTAARYVCVALGPCGNGLLEYGEQCDDGNADDADGCTSACKLKCTSLHLDGQNDYVAVPHADSLNLSGTSFTVEAWFLKESLNPADNSGIVSKFAGNGPDENGWAIVTGGEQASKPVLAFSTKINDKGSGKPTGQSPIALKKWTHVATTRDQKTGTAILWVNGKPYATGQSFEPPKTTYGLHFGVWRPPPTQYWWHGLLDEVRISSKVRYTTEFTPPLFAAVDKDTLALWHLDEGAGSIAKDASGNGHHGKLLGASWVGEGPACTAGGWCGDGMQAAWEQCDDGNASNGDGCSSDCKAESCGLRFDTTAAKANVATPGFALGGGDFTFEFWMQAKEKGSKGQVFRSNAGWQGVLTVIADNEMNGGVGILASLSQSNGYCVEPNEGVAFVVPRDGAWHHVAVVRDGTALRFHLDGKTGVSQSLVWSGCNCGPNKTPCIQGGGTGLLGGPAPKAVSLGSMRFAKGAHYKASFVPQKVLSVTAATIALWNATKCYANGTLVDEAGGDNNATGGSGVSVVAGP